MTTFKIIPYKPGSAGAKNLKKGLEDYVDYDVERVDADYIRPSNVWLINWGAGYYRGLRKNGATNTKLFNPAEAICKCVNKIDFFRIMDNEGVRIPAYTTAIRRAMTWAEDGEKIYCRTDVEGRDGRGIVVAKTIKDIVESPLYTVGIEAVKEFRVHIFQHKPIYGLEKVHDSPTAENRLVRSGGNGWEYTRHTTVPDSVKNEAVKASRALEMDFCAIDVLYTKGGYAVVLEANSAPELGPWTRDAYAREFISLTKK